MRRKNLIETLLLGIFLIVFLTGGLFLIGWINERQKDECRHAGGRVITWYFKTGCIGGNQ